MYRDEIK